MILINPDQYFVIITTSVAEIDYNFAYTFFDANNQGTKLETSQGTINTATSTEILNTNTKIQRISTISIRNVDGALTNKITVARRVDATTYAITASVQLLTGEFMEYDEGSGWKVYDANGIQKYVGSTGPAGPTGTVSAGTTAMTLGQLEFINSNNITWGLNGNSLTASFAGGGGAGNISLSAGASSGTYDSLVFSNSNGVSFGLNGSTLTASHNGLTSQSNQALSGSNGSFTFQTATFGNLNGVSFYTSNGSIVASHNGLTTQTIQPAITVNVDGETMSAGSLVLSNSNGFTFGMSDSTVTASYTVPSVAGLISAVKFSAGTLSSNRSDVTFGNGNGVSFGLETNGIITATVKTDYLTTQTVQPVAVSGSNGSFAFSTVTFGNLNGASFYTSNGSVVASYTVPSIAGFLTNINLSAGTTSNNLSRFEFADGNNVSFGLDGSTVTASVLGQTVQPVAASAANGSYFFSTLKFVDIHGVSFATSTDGIRASVETNYLTTQTVQPVALSGSNGSFNYSTATFGNLNGISFYTSNGSMVASHNALTSQSNQALSGSNGSFTFQTATFGDLNGASFYTSNGSMVLSYTVPSVAGFLTNINLSAGTTSGNASNFTFANANGVSFGLDAGTITASHNGLTTQTNQNISLYGLGNTTQNSSTVLNASNISFNAIGSLTVGFSNGSIQLSAPNALTSQTNQTLGIYAVSNTTQSTSMTVDARTISFAGAGVASVGASNGSIIISVPAGGGGLTNINLSAGTTSNNLSAFTLSNSNNVSFGLNGSVITASASFTAQTNQTLGLYAVGNTTQNSSTTLDARTVSFNGLGGASMGYSNGSIQVSAPNTSSLSALGNLTISSTSNTINFSVGQTTYNSTVIGKQLQFAQSSSSLGQNSLYFVPEVIHDYITASIVKFPVMVTLSSSAAGAFTRGHTASFAVYSRQAGASSSALTRIYSTSYTAAAVMSSNANMSISVITAVQNSTSYNTVAANSAGLNLSASVHGAREFIMPWATILAPGEYWFAHAQSSSSAGGVGNVLAMSHVIGSSVTQNRMGVSINATNNGIQKNIGLGTYSTTSGGFPNAVTLTEIRGGATWPIMFMLLDTV